MTRKPLPAWKVGAHGALHCDFGANGYVLVRCVADGTAWRLITLVYGAQEICGVRDTRIAAQLAAEDAALRLLRVALGAAELEVVP